jgi:hypothetical protein
VDRDEEGDAGSVARPLSRPKRLHQTRRAPIGNRLRWRLAIMPACPAQRALDWLFDPRRPALRSASSSVARDMAAAVAYEPASQEARGA